MENVNHPLSLRLQALYDLVPAGKKFCDVGTDHGWLPMNLVLDKKVPSAIAMDLREGPLNRAKEHIMEAGLEDLIETRLSDGLEQLHPGEAEVALISGMGGSVTLHILQSRREMVDSLEEIILQPQSEIDQVREYLHQEGFLFVDETMVEEDHKFYFLMKLLTPGEVKRRGLDQARKGDASEESKDAKDASLENPVNLQKLWQSQGLPMPMCLRLGFTFGPVLLMKRDKTLEKYLQHELDVMQGIAANLNQADIQDERIRERIKDLRNQQALTNLALQIVRRDKE